MKNQLKTILLLGALSAVLISIGGALGAGYLYGFTVLAVVLNLGAYFFSDRLILRLHGAQEVSPAQAPTLHRMVDEVARRAQIPKPRVCLLAEEQPNAFATGRNPRHGVVAVTTGLMRLLDERELRGVLAHEIAHIKNRDILVATVAAAVAAAVSYVANALSFATFFGGGQEEGEEDGGAGNGLLLALFAPLLAMLIQLGISRTREYLADETGARLCGDPMALAQALEKLEVSAQQIPAVAPHPATASLFIVNPLTSESRFMRLFSTHPTTAERVRRLHALAHRWQRVAA